MGLPKSASSPTICTTCSGNGKCPIGSVSTHPAGSRAFITGNTCSINTGKNCLFDIENPTPFHSVVSSLGAHVPIALKEKIWNNDYIAPNKLLMKEPA